MTEHTLPFVSIIIPTFRRAEGLRRALTSVAGQTAHAKTKINVIICDNSPEASAREFVIEFAKGAPFEVIFVHEPKAGVANARNTAVKAANYAFIAFLDDDEDAPNAWLLGLLETQKKFNADVVFGPVCARLAAQVPRFTEYFINFFSRFGPDQDQILKTYYGCGNSLVRRASLPTDTDPFSVIRNNMGGEDDELFQTLLDQNRTIAWSKAAFVYEDVPQNRSKLDYTLKRAFAFGQGPAFTAWQTGRYLEIVFWMLQGLIQGTLFSLLGLMAYAVNHPKSAILLDKGVRGIGKVLWFEPFKFHFYGTALLKTKAT